MQNVQTIELVLIEDVEIRVWASVDKMHIVMLLAIHLYVNVVKDIMEIRLLTARSKLSYRKNS